MRKGNRGQSSPRPDPSLPLSLHAINVGHSDDDHAILLLEAGRASGMFVGVRHCLEEVGQTMLMLSAASS
jgi:hypothetical protein